MEQVLHTSSLSLIWSYLSTAEGMLTWLADDIKEEKDTFVFMWGDLKSHHEIRRAKILKRIKNSYVRWRWEDEEDAVAFVEMRIQKNELTNDVVLLITDFAYEEDIDSLRDIWEDNFERLHRTTGI